MIIAECAVRVPGHKYTISFDCMKTRRLTAIERVILDGVKRFHDDPDEKNRMLSDMLTEVLHIKNSAFLINPCLKNMLSLGVIEENETAEEYANHSFSSLHLTQLGERMLKEGLLPGESAEKRMEVYYNPMTGIISAYPGSQRAPMGTLDIFEGNEFTDEFPAAQIRELLQSGLANDTKYIASEYHLGEIQLCDDNARDLITALRIGMDAQGNLYTDPEISLVNVDRKFHRMITPDWVNDEYIKLESLESANMKSIIGSGATMIERVADICRNGKVLCLSSTIYSQMTHYPKAMNGKTVLVFDSEEFAIKERKWIEVRIPEPFHVRHCLACNEIGEHANICRCELNYRGLNVSVPIVYENRDEYPKNCVLDWIIKGVRTSSHAKWYFYLSVLLMLPGQWGKENISECIERIVSEENDPVEAFKKINEIAQSARKAIEGLTIVDHLVDDCLRSISGKEYDAAISDIQYMMRSIVVKSSMSLRDHLVEGIMSGAKFIRTYQQLKNLDDVLLAGIDENGFIRQSEVGAGIFTEDLIADALKAMVDHSYKPIFEYNQHAALLNALHNCIDRIGLFMNGLDIFKKYTNESVREFTTSSPYFNQITAEAAQIRQIEISSIGLKYNISMLLKRVDNAASEAYVTNLRNIEVSASEDMSEGHDVFVIDTCSLINHVDILEYFDDDEHIRIPAVVVRELDKKKHDFIRNNMPDELRSVKTIIRRIDQCIDILNRKDKDRFKILIGDASLLPGEYDPKVPDNQVLATALKFDRNRLTLITDDINFRNSVRGVDIETLDGTAFIKQRQQTRRVIQYGEALSETTIRTSSSGCALVEIVAEPVKQQNKVDTDKTVPTQIEALPFAHIKKYTRDKTAVEYLSSQGVRTIGDFMDLTLEKVRMMGGKIINRNTAMRLVERKTEILKAIKENN